MKRLLGHAILLVMLTPLLSLAQDKVFDWVRANDEVVQLDPSDFHGGRVYRPGPNGGNMHVDIQAKQPVTVAMVAEQQWHTAVEHDLGGRLDYRVRDAAEAEFVAEQLL